MSGQGASVRQWGGADDGARQAFERYRQGLVHSWSVDLTALGFTLIPIFFVLDYYMMPAELLGRFAAYRIVTTAIVIAQHLIIRNTRPSRASIAHGYVFSFVAAVMIALMTTDLNGFNSSYYAGLNLVICGTNLLLPWRAAHSAANSAVVIGTYVAMNLIRPNAEPIAHAMLLNNLYFLVSLASITISIAYVKSRSVRKEFLAGLELRAARDALWGEMEVAKRIQTALLPRMRVVDGYAVAAAMLPADEVGGDYYDIVETAAGETWVAIGDVSGHGLESGLIMMMTHTCIVTTVNQNRGSKPSDVLQVANAVLNRNLRRLGTDRYMTISALLLEPDRVVFAGKHQDILVYRREMGVIEVVPTTGTWLGVVDDIGGCVADASLPIGEGDILLLFTDGVTEATDAQGRMFGHDRLLHALDRYAGLGVDEIVANIVFEVRRHMHEQNDDISLVAIQRAPVGCGRQAVASRGVASAREVACAAP